MRTKTLRIFLLLLVVLSMLLLMTSCPFFATKFTLTMLEPEGEGSVLPVVGAHVYRDGTVVDIKASPDEAWEFVKWIVNGVDYSEHEETELTMNENMTVKAVFSVILSEIEEIIARIDPTVPYTLRFVEELIPLVGDHLDEFLDLLDQDEDYLKRWASAFALQRSALDEDTLDEVEEYLDDPEPAIRALVAVAFLKNGDDRGKEVLEDLLGNDEVMVFSKPPQLLGDFALSILQVYFPAEYPVPVFFHPETTDVSGGPCDYTVTVNIVFHGDGATQDLLDSWESDAEAVWNGPDGSREWQECCTVTFDFVFTLLEEGEEPPDDAHVIEIRDVKAAHTSYVNTPLPTPGSTETTTGVWDNLDTANVVAHEIGHLMGLDDEYHYDEDGDYVNDNVQDEDPQSIMAQTWGNVSALPDHIASIMALADIQCECDYSMTISPAYDVNISPGTHSVEVVVTKADGNPAKGITVTFTVIPGIEDTEVTTDEDGKASFSYSREYCYSNEDEIEAWAKCNADAMALKLWISLSEIEPIPEWPYDGQKDYPYSKPLLVVFDVGPEEAKDAENLEFVVTVYHKGEAIFTAKGKETTIETGMELEPGEDYEIEITPISGPPETEGTSKRIEFTTAVPAPEYVSPQENIKVDLSASDVGIRSHEFAKMIEDTIVEAGYKYMGFFFGQCFGGGMFEDLKGFDNTLLKSAARWDEVSYGHPDDTHNFWLEELRKAIDNDRSIAHADDDAYKNDPCGPVKKEYGEDYVEHPQGLYDGDQYVKLSDEAESKHAIIFSGASGPGQRRHENDADNWEETLTSAPMGFEVTKLVGATKEDLETALAEVSQSMNENEVFIFIAAGHGSVGQLVEEETEVPPGDSKEVSFVGDFKLLDILNEIGHEHLFITMDIPVGPDEIRHQVQVFLNDLTTDPFISDPEKERSEFEIHMEDVFWGADNILYIFPLVELFDPDEVIVIYDIFLDTGPVMNVLPFDMP